MNPEEMMDQLDAAAHEPAQVGAALDALLKRQRRVSVERVAQRCGVPYPVAEEAIVPRLGADLEGVRTLGGWVVWRRAR